MDEANATLRREDRPDAVCLVVEGDIDLADIGRFHDAAYRLIRDARSPAVMDLTGVTFFNSSGIGALVTAQTEAEAAGVELIVEPSPIVRRVLEVIGLADKFELRDRP
jgi:anti-sigma B factor antagonist